MANCAFRVMLVVLAAVSIAACQATPTRRAFKEGWKDSVVSTKVKYKLTADRMVKKRNIDVDTWRGVVTLTGRVTSSEEKERAEQLAWQVKGVRGVDNFLRLADDYNAEAGRVVMKDELTGEKSPVGTKVKPVVEKKAPVKTAVKKEPQKAVKTAKPVEKPDVKEVEPVVTGKSKMSPIYEEAMKEDEEPNMSTAKRGSWNKPDSAKISEEDLTDEDRLARDAAEELKKLRGEETNGD